MSTKQPKAIGVLPPGQIMAGVMIGCNWVQAFAIHVDPAGALYVMDVGSRLIPTKPGCTPDLRRIKEGLQACWNHLGPLAQGDYGGFCLCLPTWCTRHDRVATSVEIASDERIPGFGTPVVDERDVRRLTEAAAAACETDEHVTVDLFPHYFLLDSGRRVADPRGETTNRLGISTDAVLVERGFVHSILDCLHDMDVKVDVMMSTAAASGGSLSTDRHRGAAVVDLGERYTAVTLFDRGDLRHVGWWEGGSEDVLKTTAHNLTSTRDIVASVSGDRDLLLLYGDPNNEIVSLPLFSWARRHPVLRNLEYGAQEAVTALVDRIVKELGAAVRKEGLDIERIVLLGDEPMTVRMLKQLLEDRTGIPCRIGMPATVRLSLGMKLQGYWRTVSLLRQGVRFRARQQPFLERYNESLMDAFSRHAAEQTRRMAWLTVQRVADRVSRPRTPLMLEPAAPAALPEVAAPRREEPLPAQAEALPTTDRALRPRPPLRAVLSSLLM